MAVISADAGDQGVVIDCDTGEVLPHVIWADTDAGVYEHYVLNAAGEIMLDMTTGEVLRVRRRGRIRFIRWLPGDP